MSKLQRQCDIKIYQNWDNIRLLYDNLLDKKLAGKFKETDLTEEFEGSTLQYQNYTQITKSYSFGFLGTLMSSNDLTIDDWTTWSGTFLEKQLPWAEQAREYFSGLNFNGFTWSPMVGSAIKHVDAPGKQKTAPMCKINYIVKSDDHNARTVSYDPIDETYTETYYSIPKTAWLLNIAKPHEVINDSNKKRELLQFNFNNTFEEVSEYLDKKDPIVFGKQI